MKKQNKCLTWAIATAAVTFVTVHPVFAQDEAQPAQSANDRFQQLAEMDDGVQNIKRDKNGNIATLMVIGKGKVSRAFSKQRAKQVASREAIRNARNAFAQFLNTHVTWAETAAGEVVVKEKGSAAGDDGAATSTQEGAATDVSQQQSKAYSAAALSGLRQLWGGFDKDGMRVVIMGWKLSDCKGIANMSKAMGKSARASVNQAKALEGAHRQDPDAAYRREERRNSRRPAAPAAPAAQAPQTTGYGNNATPAQTSGTAADADDFF